MRSTRRVFLGQSFFFFFHPWSKPFKLTFSFLSLSFSSSLKGRDGQEKKKTVNKKTLIQNDTTDPIRVYGLEFTRRLEPEGFTIVMSALRGTGRLRKRIPSEYNRFDFQFGHLHKVNNDLRSRRSESEVG